MQITRAHMKKFSLNHPNFRLSDTFSYQTYDYVVIFHLVARKCRKSKAFKILNIRFLKQKPMGTETNKTILN